MAVVTQGVQGDFDVFKIFIRYGKAISENGDHALNLCLCFSQGLYSFKAAPSS